ncbi:MAG: hypothetical protein GY896_18280 [Gammaproteobacteria bacterium]|nr:hypothetical protein [Gammaproteobacteria bacterium]
MKQWLLGTCLWLSSIAIQASDHWIFDSRIAVTGAPAGGVFHHLEGSGRRHIAVSSSSVAVAWEDNRTQDPQIYVAIKSFQQKEFAPAMQVSNGSEAFEPSIDALPGNRFVLAWEQDAAVFARILTSEGFAESIRLSTDQASHVSIATFGDQVFAVWREQLNRRWFVKLASLTTQADKLIVDSLHSVESVGLQTPVLFPSLAVNSAGLCVAWEDRRAGHTRLLFSHSTDAGITFTEPQFLNEFFSNRNQYDQGNGVTRVSLASFAQDEILAAWMDKRRGGLGYGIFAALGAEAGANFGPNEKVHGAEGDRQPHYNPATAGNPAGDFAIAWDDFRRGDSDVWISSYNDDDEWGEDYTPAVASGSGEQSHPAVTLDGAGNLHLLWIERAQQDAPSQLWYSYAQARNQP